MSPAEIVHFPTPLRPDAVVINLGTADEYVPPNAVEVWQQEIKQKWGGCQVNQLDAGHVTGLLVERDTYREAIVEVGQRLRRLPEIEPGHLQRT